MAIRRLVAVAVVFLAVGGTAFGQRGGARGGGGGGFHGGGGGFHGGAPAVGGSHAGFAPGGAGRYAGGARVPSYRPNNYGGGGVPYRGGGIAGARPSFYARGRGDGDRDGRRWDRRDRVGYGVVGPLDYGWLDAGELGYGDDGWYPDDGSYGEVAANGPEDEQGPDANYPDAGNYVEQPYAQGSAGPTQGDTESVQPVASVQRVSPRLYESDAVTLVFKDGRPAEKIHNYALTRTTLYVTDGRHREIAVADLDLAATEKANRAAGVNFQLPQAQ